VSAAADGSVKSGAWLRNEPMARHTSWRVGGPADLFARPATLDELRALLSSLEQDVPVHWVGFGSNLLVRDGGIRGVVICTSALQKDVERVGAAGVHAGAGVPCANLARLCVEWRLGPAAFFAGIPGTLGGALAMNAGAFGGETWNDVIGVETIDRHGTVRFRERSDYRIGYRSVQGGDGEWFLAASFSLRADFAEDRDTLQQLLGKRRQTQPIGKPSAGSVFRNPPDAHAGDLIEKAGLKGLSRGGARVSDKHANFIVNTGNATARDIEELIETVRGRVRDAFGVELELEVRVLGEGADGDRRAS
jgi:UDP-N-acetylmuramate dehydrogenase